MATRFYLPAIGFHPRANGSVPVFDAGWTTTTAGIRRRLVLTKEGTTFTTITATKTAATNPSNVLIAQFVSPPLQVQTISAAGFLKGIIQAFCSTTPLADAQMIVKVMSADGLTSRGTLFALQSAAESNDFFTSQRNIKWPLNYTGSGGALTAVTAQDSDNIVIEIGARVFTAATGGTVSIRLGDVLANTDLLENETDTADNIPWFEFSQTLLFWDTGESLSREFVGAGDAPLALANQASDGGIQVNLGSIVGASGGNQSGGSLPPVPLTVKYKKVARDTGLPGISYVSWVVQNPFDPYPGIPAGTLTDEYTIVLST